MEKYKKQSTYNWALDYIQQIINLNYKKNEKKTKKHYTFLVVYEMRIDLFLSELFLTLF